MLDVRLQDTANLRGLPVAAYRGGRSSHIIPTSSSADKSSMGDTLWVMKVRKYSTIMKYSRASSVAARMLHSDKLKQEKPRVKRHADGCLNEQNGASYMFPKAELRAQRLPIRKGPQVVNTQQIPLPRPAYLKVSVDCNSLS